MNRLLKAVRLLRKGAVKRRVDCRMKEFESNGRKSSPKIFSELCFCILTANYNAERAVVIQKKIDNGFLVLPEKQLAGRLKKLGYRFPNTRAK
ncbi:MAG: N-glycosylase, partial [Candidatus Altiarchaeales archaeon]|nr:N-glycosylase [Candidatus Altiarchaeales archaeon]